jgi:carboxymethylenebutenolidase
MNDRITIKGQAGAFGAYTVRPKTLPAPAVVVLQEVFGVNADIRKHCDNLAEQGFIAAAPDLFVARVHRQGGRPLMTFLTTVRYGVDAAVAYHGGDTEKYLDEVIGLRAPLLMHLAEEDEFHRRSQARTTNPSSIGEDDRRDYASERQTFDPSIRPRA